MCNKLIIVDTIVLLVAYAPPPPGDQMLYRIQHVNNNMCMGNMSIKSLPQEKILDSGYATMYYNYLLLSESLISYYDRS